MNIIQSNHPACPECRRHYTTPAEEYCFLQEDNITQCAMCGWLIRGFKMKGMSHSFEVPSFLRRLLKSLVIRNMLGINGADKALIAANEPAISEGVSLDFQHRELMIGGSMTWYQVAKARKFTPHETDFAGITKYATIPAGLIREFVDVDSFLVSEAPGTEGRGLRNAGIRLLKYAESDGAIYYVRAFLTWDVNYRRLPDRGVEEVARK